VIVLRNARGEAGTGGDLLRGVLSGPLLALPWGLLALGLTYRILAGILAPPVVATVDPGPSRRRPAAGIVAATVVLLGPGRERPSRDVGARAPLADGDGGFLSLVLGGRSMGVVTEGLLFSYRIAYLYFNIVCIFPATFVISRRD
jgi:hypothetical protein